MNDPNGPIFWKGQYHLFYQYNPNGAFWGDMHWGHAISKDMVHWRHLPLALSPTPGSADADGCFSGSALLFEGQVALIYTGVRSVPATQATSRGGGHSFRESQCLAVSRDRDLMTWTKLNRPIIANPPPGMEITGFRDPSAWRDGEWIYLTVGSGVAGEGGALLLYRSKTLHDWEYMHVVASGMGRKGPAGDPVASADMWECPELFPLGGKHALLYSSEGKVHWQTGVLDVGELRFHPEQKGLLDYGDFYAADTQLDQSGQRICWGWLPETRPEAEYRAAGWAGVMALPRQLALDAQGRLTSRFLPALAGLRRQEQRFEATHDEQRNQRHIAGLHLQGSCGEILCAFQSRVAPIRLSLVSRGLGGSPSGKWMVLKFDPAHSGRVLIDNQAIPLSGKNMSGLELHFFIDGSVMELILNGEAAFTKRFYYPGNQAPEIGIRCSDSSANGLSISIWQLEPISRDRLTT